MIQLIIFGLSITFITYMIINSLLNNPFNIGWFIVTILGVFYILYKNNIDTMLNRYIKYMVIAFIAITIFKYVEYLFMYGLSTPGAVFYIMTITLILIILSCIYLFNSSL